VYTRKALDERIFAVKQIEDKVAQSNKPTYKIRGLKKINVISRTIPRKMEEERLRK
jgi:hypothetical protein